MLEALLARVDHLFGLIICNSCICLIMLMLLHMQAFAQLILKEMICNMSDITLKMLKHSAINFKTVKSSLGTHGKFRFGVDF